MPINVGGNEINSVGARVLVDSTIPTSNLNKYLDAGFISSYPGTGTTWTELVSGTPNGTFTNGPTFSTDGGGCIVFDGTNDYVDWQWTLPGGPWSVYFWFKTSSVSGALMSHYSGGPVNNGFNITSAGKLEYLYYNNLGWNYSGNSTGTACNNNTWTLGTYVAKSSSTGLFTIYRNAVSDFTFTPAGSGIGNANIGSIGSLWGFNYLNGRIAMVAVYYEEHSASQVLQFYNATRARFGV